MPKLLVTYGNHHFIMMIMDMVRVVMVIIIYNDDIWSICHHKHQNHHFNHVDVL